MVEVVCLNSCFHAHRKDLLQTSNPDLRLGVASIAGYLREQGVSVIVLDPQASELSLQGIASQILDAEPKYVCLPGYTEEIKQTARIAGLLKDSGSQIVTIVGGYHVTALPIQTLYEFPCFDLGVVGEAELKVSRIIQGEEPSNIPGIVYRDPEGTPVLNPNDKRRIQIDELPFPAWDLYNLSLYDCKLPIEPLRGCPFQCIFCFRATGKQVIYRSPQRFVDELEYFSKCFGITRFRFLAGTFPLKRKHAKEICEMIIARKLNLTWVASTRVDTVDYELLDLMKKSGCRRLQFGIESGDPDILISVAKGTTPELCIKALKLCHKIGIKAGLNFIIGLPNETKASIKATYKLAVKLRKYAITVNFAILVPYPGTRVYDMALSKEGAIGLCTRDWDDFGKQAGFALTHDNFEKGELQKYQSKFLIKYYAGAPIKALKQFRKQGTMAKVIQLLKRVQ